MKLSCLLLAIKEIIEDKGDIEIEGCEISPIEGDDCIAIVPRKGVQVDKVLH